MHERHHPLYNAATSANFFPCKQSGIIASIRQSNRTRRDSRQHDSPSSIIQHLPRRLRLPKLFRSYALTLRVLLALVHTRIQLLRRNLEPLVPRRHDRERIHRDGDMQAGRRRQQLQLARRGRLGVVVCNAGEHEVAERAKGVEGWEEEFAAVEQVLGLPAGMVDGYGDVLEHGPCEGRLEGRGAAVAAGDDGCGDLDGGEEPEGIGVRRDHDGQAGRQAGGRAGACVVAVCVCTRDIGRRGVYNDPGKRQVSLRAGKTHSMPGRQAPLVLVLVRCRC